MKSTIGTFKSKASYPQQAIVMIFDLDGFSKFFSQPDVQDYVPKFINLVMEAIDICLNGGDNYWGIDEKGTSGKMNALPKHIHSKFLGDGGMYIWKHSDFTHFQLISLVNRCWNLRVFFHKVVEKAKDIIPVIDIPQNIRFGMAAGSVYKLTYLSSNREEFIGYSINLASRLQSYCHEIGFILSGRLNIKSELLNDYNYRKVVAKKIKGLPGEVVIVDKSEFDNLKEEKRLELFE